MTHFGLEPSRVGFISGGGGGGVLPIQPPTNPNTVLLTSN